MPDGRPADVDLLRRRVMNVVGHELRTPVTTLVGLADELEARSGGGDDLVAATRAAWRSRGDEASLGVSGAAAARAREAVVAKVLDMVLDNALVHGAPPFSATASEVDGRAVLEIANGGHPVSDADLELAIEAFYRSERGVTNAPGLGLGLAIANTLVTADGGTLSLRPGDPSGVVARIELPLA